MNGLQVFSNDKFGAVRTLEENGKVLLCGSDVARALGYHNPSRDVTGMLRDVASISYRDALPIR